MSKENHKYIKRSALHISVFTFGYLLSYALYKDKKSLDPRVYYPHIPKKPFNLYELIFGYGKYHSPLIAEKQNLKYLGLAYYKACVGDDFDVDFKSLKINQIKDPQKIGMDLNLFYPSHLQNKYIRLPNNWQIPDNWHDFNQSNNPYVFVGNINQKYSASADVPLFIVRNGYQAYPNFFNAVYEDGHVGKVSYEEAIKLWKKAGVWNE